MGDIQQEVAYMQRALELARLSLGYTHPNPAVGAVVVKQGRIIGEGRHVKCGEAHAEAAALAEVVRRGRSARGATVFCTLEPCSKPGRVGACTDALIAAGVQRVVWACNDPGATNGNRAMRVLRAAGIAAESWHNLRAGRRKPCADAAKRLIRAFAKAINGPFPFVTVKLAMSLDGKICDDSGNAKWVSSESARAATHQLRNEVDAIMVGAETVRRDDPSLLSRTRPNPHYLRFVVTRSGKLPAQAQLFSDAAKDRTFVIVVGKRQPSVRGCQLIRAASLKDALVHIHQLGVNHLLCEGGLGLARSLAAAGLVDEWVTVLAPKVIGAASMADAVTIPAVSVLPDWNSSQPIFQG